MLLITQELEERKKSESLCLAPAAMETTSVCSAAAAAVTCRRHHFLQKTLGVVDVASSQHDPDSRCAAVQIVNSQSFFIRGPADHKHQDVLRPVSEAARSQVRKLAVLESPFDHLVQRVVKQRLMLSVHVLHTL